ncbi:MAG: hypothetical protein ACLPJJ_02390 [Acidocella sp.]|uniref:hypothetical protein n=1 Tax=Acidocella sp. TaxID=50710 RepID=UPI003FD7B121
MQGQPQNLRGLKALVGIMGVLIVIGTTVVIGTVIHRLYARFTAPPMPVAPLAAPMAPVAGNVPVAAALAPGEHIAGIAGAGPDVAVWVSGPKGDRVLLLDPASGMVRVGLQSAP